MLLQCGAAIVMVSTTSLLSLCSVFPHSIYLHVLVGLLALNTSGYTIPRSILENLEFCSEYSVSSHIMGFSSRILWFSAQVYVVIHGFPG